ncbi:MAG: C4-dicarboxylate ABC transporter substrate-binding protein [Alphaproteobacteria bacterium]|nr:C4-dicarboxylate ABC transporter substrate-binding protein [Alphaproteobacteria bacterium]
MTRLLTATATAVGLALAAQAAAAQTTWDMPTPYPDATFHTQNVIQFAEDVAAATDGELEITVHSAGSLFKHPEIKRAVQTGQVQIGEMLISLLSNDDPIFAVDTIPFLADSYDDAEALWAASRGAVEELLAEDGLMLLYAVPWPSQGIYVNQEVESVADMEGVPFRAYNASTSRLAELMGAVPTQVEVPDIPQAFSTGIVEAMITSPSTGANSAAWDYVSHFYDTQAWLPKNMVMVSQDAFDALSGDVQQALLDAAAQAETRGWEMSMAEAEEKKQVLADNGMVVAEPSDALAEGLAEIGETMTAEWLEAAGEDGQAILDAYHGN